MRNVIIAGALAVILVVAVLIYFQWGWTRMDSECGFGHNPLEQRQTDVPFDSGGSKSVSFSWHWSDGFTCTYSNGKTRSSYWF